MISKEKAQYCMSLVKQLSKSAAYQPVILPYGLQRKYGHDRTCLVKTIFGSGCNSFLDIGCNVGHLCYLARQKAGFTGIVTGVEHDPVVFKVTCLVGEAWDFATINSNLQDYISDQKFDAVALLSVLHHRIVDPVKEIKRYGAMANKRLVLELPLTNREGVAVPSNLDYSYWKWLFNLDGVISLITSMGFKIAENKVSPLKFHGKVVRQIIVGER